MERRKGNLWLIIGDIALIAIMAVGIASPAFYYRWHVMTPDFAIFWIVFPIVLSLSLYLVARGLNKLSRSFHEVLAWKTRNLPPNRNFYWRPPPDSDPRP